MFSQERKVKQLFLINIYVAGLYLKFNDTTYAKQILKN